MKNLLITAAAALIAMTAPAQSIKQTINNGHIGPYKMITLMGKLRVELVRSTRDSISIDLYDSDLSKIRYGVKKDALEVKLTVGSGNRNGRADVRIYYSAPFTELTVSGGDVLLRDALRVGMLTVTLADGAKIDGQLNVMDLELNASGKAEAKLAGRAKYNTVVAGSRCRIDCRLLESTSVRAVASGSSELCLWPQERAELEVRGGARIFYRGTPAIYKETLPSIRLGATIGSIL